MFRSRLAFLTDNAVSSETTAAFDSWSGRRSPPPRLAQGAPNDQPDMSEVGS